MHVELDCPWVSVSGGLRLLAPDGRSFRLRGATASADGHVEVPAKVAHHLYEAGVATEPAIFEWRSSVIMAVPTIWCGVSQRVASTSQRG